MIRSRERIVLVFLAPGRIRNYKMSAWLIWRTTTESGSCLLTPCLDPIERKRYSQSVRAAPAPCLGGWRARPGPWLVMPGAMSCPHAAAGPSLLVTAQGPRGRERGGAFRKGVTNHQSPKCKTPIASGSLGATSETRPSTCPELGRSLAPIRSLATEASC